MFGEWKKEKTSEDYRKQMKITDSKEVTNQWHAEHAKPTDIPQEPEKQINWLYQSFTAHQHQKGHTVPKQVSPLDDDDDITESTRKKCYGSTIWELQ